MSSDKLASGTVDGFDVECKVLYLHTTDYDESDIKNHYAYYSDFCWNVDSDVSWDEYWQSTDSDDWCSTWRASIYWILCAVGSCLMTCAATCWVQTLCAMERCCCPTTCPRIFFVYFSLMDSCNHDMAK